MDQYPAVAMTGQGTPGTPHRDGLEHTPTLREELYRPHPPKGETILMLVQPADTTDGPMEG